MVLKLCEGSLHRPLAEPARSVSRVTREGRGGRQVAGTLKLDSPFSSLTLAAPAGSRCCTCAPVYAYPPYIDEGLDAVKLLLERRPIVWLGRESRPGHLPRSDPVPVLPVLLSSLLLLHHHHHLRFSTPLSSFAAFSAGQVSRVGDRGNMRKRKKARSSLARESTGVPGSSSSLRTSRTPRRASFERSIVRDARSLRVLACASSIYSSNSSSR